ncbi:unnamed protein product [Caenorhabditis bovis]|uniref:Uncharacterized protein n=1 Tax=Caenorhabditis bovis TaxID=2654633 RepID=A0A8S1F1G9_9PELO|nr:unnamed protein product [Caenorhabditis bovis]
MEIGDNASEATLDETKSKPWNINDREAILARFSFDGDEQCQPDACEFEFLPTLNCFEIVNSLERFIVGSTTEKAYKRLDEGVQSSRRALESLLARNAGTSDHSLVNEAVINNKSYTLDANGRVCLVKNDDRKGGRVQECLRLQREVKELRSIYKDSLSALELIMSEHRKMMMRYMRSVREHPKRVANEKLRSTMNATDARMRDEFALIAKAVEMSIENEEKRSVGRVDAMRKIESENFLLKQMLDIDDIRNASVDELVRKWREILGVFGTFLSKI